MTKSEGLGKVVIISGPSGVGKTTVVRRLIGQCPLPLVLSVSATTRQQRDGEQDGIDYIFLSRDEFAARRQTGDFLECFEVFGKGHWYGTLRETVASGLADGKWVILEIDVQGAMKVIDSYSDAITIFVKPSSLEELERRLRGRGTETEERIQHRLETARHELSFIDRYQHQVINDELDQAVQEISHILVTSGA